MERSEDSDGVERLEERIAELAESLDRCRKISFAAKLAIAVGAGLIALILLGFISFGPTLFFAALTAIIGGIVVLGSNAGTWVQTESKLREAETLRAELIGQLDLHLVGEDRPTIH